MPAWMKYTLLRILVFAVLLVALLLLQINPFIATFLAAIVGLIISALFFRTTRDQVAVELANRPRRTKERTDDVEEDSLDTAADRADDIAE